MSRSFVSRAAAGVAAIALAAASIAAAPLHSHAVVGTLQKVDGQTLTVQTSKGVETLMLAPGAKVHLGSQTVSTSELSAKTGSRVKVHYTEAGGQKQADSVTVSSAKQSTHSEHAATTANASQK